LSSNERVSVGILTFHDLAWSMSIDPNFFEFPVVCQNYLGGKKLPKYPEVIVCGF
jgi:hypothetical protein